MEYSRLSFAKKHLMDKLTHSEKKKELKEQWVTTDIGQEYSECRSQRLGTGKTRLGKISKK